MAGQLIRRGKSTWLVRLYRGRTASGKRRYVNKTIHGTKRQAQQWLTKALHEISSNTFAEPSKQTVSEYLSDWLRTVARQRLGPRSLAGT